MHHLFYTWKKEIQLDTSRTVYQTAPEFLSPSSIIKSAPYIHALRQKETHAQASHEKEKKSTQSAIIDQAISYF